MRLKTINLDNNTVNQHMKKHLALYPALFGILATSAHSAVISGYYFNGNANPDTVDANFNSSNATYNNFSASVFYTGDNYDIGGSNAAQFKGGHIGSDSTENGSYIGFNLTLDAGAGTSYELGEITWQSKANITVSGSYAVNTQLYYSLDGGSNWLSSSPVNASVTGTGGSTSSSWTQGTLDLSGTVINPGEEVQFRLVHFDNSGDTSSRNSRTDAIEINAFAIPEPSSAALLGLAGLGLITRRRR